MIFIAPLQGEVDDQLIVSPISTMVYRSMQENGTSFEVAKESVANELGVSSDTLLTNYHVENPSADHIAMQERSDVETKKLGLSMTYHDNEVQFNGFNYDCAAQSGNYVVHDYYIPSAQDPDHHIKIGTVVKLKIDDDITASLHFELGRSASSAVATYWKNRVNPDQNNYNKDPDKLNFAMKGTLTIKTTDGCSYVLPDLYLAQGHTWDGYNNWWIGGPHCWHSGDKEVGCSSSGTDGPLFFKMTDGVNKFLIGAESWAS